jgi:hypothetical protein
LGALGTRENIKNSAHEVLNIKFEDFVKIGQQLKELNEQLVDFKVKKSAICRKSSPLMKYADKASKELDRLRSDLEEIMSLEHRANLDLLEAQTFPDSATHIFYGQIKFSFNVEKGVWEYERNNADAEG